MIKTRKSRATGGGIVLWIDLTFRARTTGQQERYRRAAQVQTRAGATSEERRIIEHFGVHGTIAALLAPLSSHDPPETPKAPEVHTWADAVALYERWAAGKLKPSTRQGYRDLLDSSWFDGWAGLDVRELASDEARLTRWDGEMARKLGESRRRNFHVVLRTVMRVSMLEGWHTGLAQFRTDSGKTGRGLPRVGQRVVLATRAEDVEALIHEDDGAETRVGVLRARRCARFAFAIMAWAGLRAGELRALRWEHVDMDGGLIHVRESLCVGETAAPKSGSERTVRIGARLVAMLRDVYEERQPQPSAYVAPAGDGRAWADKTLYRVLRRAGERMGLPRGRLHGLRHYFVTSMARAGIHPRAVQRMAGHSTLNVTMRYIDAVDADLVAAARVFDRPPPLKVIDGGKATGKRARSA